LIVDPITALADGADSYAPYLRDSGELHDPVFDEPTQYGTAYHAYVNAVLAVHGPTARRAEYRDRARRGLDAALRHTEDPDLPATASGFARETAGVRSRGNHRDFTWPPILKAFRLLRADEFADRIRAVDIERSFSSRPPSNWSAVWLSGEWRRIQDGLSPYSVSDFDAWLQPFLRRIDLDLGWYEEPGKPNSYDLFTRFHLADIVAEGYAGTCLPDLRRLFGSGLQRSLAMQLSDGALASAHRSSGQSWTDGVQIAYLSLHSEEAAKTAAQRAFASFIRWQRPGGPYSPVHNVLPPALRVGYEGYTADAHYGNLALAFLADGIRHGFAGGQGDYDRSAIRVERAPTFRAVAHRGRISAAVNGEPAANYDAFGLTEVTFGVGRRLHIGPSTRHLQSGMLINPGLALRDGPGRRAPNVLCANDHKLAEIAERNGGIRLAGDIDDIRHALDVRLTDNGAEITESTPGKHSYQSIVVPYLRDTGNWEQTDVRAVGHGIELRLGIERVLVETDAPIECWLDIPYGYENRRGVCGLLRIDLRDPADTVTYRLTSPD
jgi:hypothetical protein